MADLSQIKLPNNQTYNLKDSAAVTSVAWDTTNKKLRETINGSTTDVVTGETILNGMTSEQVTNALEYTPPHQPIGEASGNIATFEAAGLPLKSLKIAINPIQDLHGYDAPWVGGAGKNKCPINSGSITVGDFVVFDTPLPSGTYSVSLKASRTPSSGSYASMVVYDIDGNAYSPVIGIASTDLDGVKTIKAQNISYNNGISKLYVYSIAGLWSESRNYTLTISDLQIEQGSIATSYAPYSNICPISGWDEVNVTRCGKNLFDDEDGELGKWYDAQGVKNTDSTGYISPFFKIKNSEYTIQEFGLMRLYSYSFVFFDENKNFIQRNNYIVSSSPMPRTVTFSNNAKYVRVQINRGNTLTIQGVKDCMIQVEQGTTATTYEPYNGHTYTIDLDGTRYGGKLDVVNGVLIVTHGIVDLGALTWGADNGRSGYFYTSGLRGELKPNGDGLCSGLKYHNIAVGGIADGEISTATSYGTGYIFARYSSIQSASDFKTAMNGVQLVYELATPQTIQLTPTIIKSLQGENNIYASSGEIIKLEYITPEYDGMIVELAEEALTSNTLGSADIGSATNPIYLDDGVPKACTYSLNKTVPSNANFTNTWRPVQDNLTSSSATDSLSAKQGKILNDNLQSYKTISNADIASFDDGSNLPLKSLEVAIEPQQDLHGYDYPWVGGAGKNKLNLDFSNDTSSFSGLTFSHTDSTIKLKGTVAGDAYKIFNLTAPPNVELNTNYTLSAVITGTVEKCLIGVYFKNGNTDVETIRINTTDTQKNTNQIQSQFDNALFIIEGLQSGDYFDCEIKLQLEKSSSSTSWLPYSNICPISGWDECKVTGADDLENPTVSNVYTIDLDGTRYGGKLDVVSGVMTVTHGYLKLTDTDYNWQSGVWGGGYRYFATNRITDAKNNQSCQSSIYKAVTSFTEKKGISIDTAGNANQIDIRTPDFSSLADWKSFLASNPVDVRYELATPQTIQLSPTIIKSLQGGNNFFADSGEIIRVEYQPDNIVGELRSEIADVKKVHTVKITNYDDINHTATLDKSVRQIMNLLSNGEYVVVDTNGLWVELDVNYYLRPLEMGAVMVTFNLDNVFESPAPTPFSYGQTVTFSYIDSYQLYCELPYLGDDEYGDTNEVECRLARYTAF